MDEKQFLRRFFGEGNRFSYDKVVEKEGAAYESIRRWMTDLLQQGRPVVLPRWTAEGVIWYGIAQTEQSAQQLGEEVKAFVGPSYSTYTGERSVLDRDDPVEQAIRDFAGGTALRFTGDDQGIKRALDRMYAVRERRTPYQQDEDLGIGIVLRRFEMALRADDRAAAEKHLGYLRERDLLDRRNLRHLIVRMLAAFGAWEELLERDEIPEILQQEKRPLRVTRALIQAVYHVHLASFEEADDLEGAVEHFSSSVLPDYGDLFATRSSMQSPEVLKAFMMKAVSGEEIDDGLRSDLVGAAKKTGLDDPFFETLIDYGGEPESAPDVTDPVAEATTAMVEGNFDEAFRLLQQANASPGKVRGFVYLHNSLQTLDVEHALETALNDLGESDRENLVEQYEVCRRIAEAGPPSGWTDWLGRVQRRDYDTAEQALQDAEKLVEEWHPQQVLDTPNGLAQFVRAVEEAPLDGETGRIVSHALPKLLASLQDDPEYPRSTFQGLYGAVQGRIPYTDDLTESDLTVYQDLAGVRLQHGVSKSAYEEIIEQAEYLWEEAGSASRIDWLLDFAELLVLAPSRDEEAQLRFLSSVAQAIQRYREHIEPIQIDLFCSLCEQVDQPEIAERVLELVDLDEEDESGDELCRALSGKTLGIYTLTESAGRRVKTFLESRCGGVTIKLRHDKKGSAELHRVAKNADYFLVVTRSATHAATDVIEKHVPTDRLIYPRGKGESSMVRDLTETLRQEK